MPDGGVFALTNVLILVPAGLGVGAVAMGPWSPGLGLLLGTLFASLVAALLAQLWRTHLADPGRLAPGMARPETPDVRRVAVRGASVSVKFCSSCRIWRPPRASHCRDCGVCVRVHDHHCPWVGNCVGAGNYKHFVTFLILLFVDCIYVAAQMGVILLVSTLHNGVPLMSRQHVLPLVVLIVAALFAFSSGSLMAYHISLIRQSRTTREDFKLDMLPPERRAEHENVFDNHEDRCFRVVCGPERWGVPGAVTEADFIIENDQHRLLVQKEEEEEDSDKARLLSDPDQLLDHLA